MVRRPVMTVKILAVQILVGQVLAGQVLTVQILLMLLPYSRTIMIMLNGHHIGVTV
jgi:hypothetical protein